MKFLKILFFGFLGLVALAVVIVVGVNLITKINDPRHVELKLVGQHWNNQNYYVYVLADPRDTTPPERVGQQLRYICQSGGDICAIGVWQEERFAPTKMPMTELELERQYFSYLRNRKNNHEVFIESRDGKNTEVRLPR